MKVRIVLLVLGIACLVPGGANASGVRGIVVGKQHGLLLVAGPSGVVTTVAARAAIGSRLAGTEVVGHATRARIHGIVVKQLGSTLILSSNRHLLAVHTRRLADFAPKPGSSVAPGSVVNATVGVHANGELDEQGEDEVGQVNGPIQVQAMVTAVGAGTVTLSVNGQSFTVNLPAGLTLPATLVNQTVTLNIDVRGHGGDDEGDDDGGGGGDDD